MGTSGSSPEMMRGMLMGESPNVSLTLSNQPDNVLLVRETLSGIAETVGVDAVDLNDIRTAVTEACNNVVLHAYEGEEGPLQIEIFTSTPTRWKSSCATTARASSRTSAPTRKRRWASACRSSRRWRRALSSRTSRAVARRCAWSSRRRARASLDALRTTAFSRRSVPSAELSTTTGLAIAPDTLARKVLPRVMCVLAARAHFTTDRISDTELVADALVSEAFAAEHRQPSERRR